MRSYHSKKLTEMINVASLCQLLRGSFSEENFNEVKQIIPKSKLIVFFSSTFTDTHGERNIIMEELLPELQSRAKIFGVSVTFVDMRFGMKDENTKDHMTWIACADQIRYCHEESDGMFFMSLQGDKYGYMPIPKSIKKSLVDDKFPQFNEKSKVLFSDWYLLDDNSIPPQYELRPLEDKDDEEFWSNALPILRQSLEGIPFDEISCPDICVGRSVSEWEALLAMKLSPERCYWFHRSFESGVNISYDENRKMSDFCDFKANEETALKHQSLISAMRRTIPQNNITELNCPSLLSYMSQDEKSSEYLDTFRTSMRNTLCIELDKVIDKVLAWSNNGHGLGCSGEDISEMVHHCRILQEKCRTFQGREELLAEALRYLRGEVDVEEDKLLDITLCIIGSSGFGKTALMSKLAELCQTIFPSTPIIVRFCGTSNGSVDGLALINSICKQIEIVYSLEKSINQPTFSDAVKYFHDLLLTYPVILFIDSLDQLTDNYLARSKLSFLVGVKCHPDTRIVVSALPDDKDPATGKWGKYVYLCDTRLAEFKTPRVVVKAMEVQSADTRSVLSSVLSLYNHKLTEKQTERVLKSMHHESSALYLALAVNVVRYWSSFDEQGNDNTIPGVKLNLKNHLQGSVFGLINQIFDQLEADYGYALTRSAFAFIVFSRSGVSDIAMQDLLSLRDDVLREVFQYSKPARYWRVPLHVWLRLCSAMRGLIVERSYKCWNFYHRQLSKTIAKRYSSAEIQSFRQTMGSYFANIIPKHIFEERLITPQPLTFTELSIWYKRSVMNDLRCVEGFYHLVHGGLLEEAVKEVTSFEVICGCILAGQGFALVECVRLLLSKLKTFDNKTEEIIKIVDHYFRWMYQDMTLMFKAPRSMICSSASSQPKVSKVKQDLYKLMEETKAEVQTNPTFDENDECCRGVTLGGFENFTPLMATLYGHIYGVTSVVVSDDGGTIVSGSHDKIVRVWDVLSGACVNTLEGHSDSVTSICIDSDGSRIVSGSWDKNVRVWEALSGACVNTLKGHSDRVSCVCIHNKDEFKRIISGSEDKTIKVWDALSGACLNTLNGHSHYVSSVCVSTDGNKILSGSWDQTVKVWNSNSWECVNTFEGHSQGVRSVCISCDGHRIVSGSEDNTVKLWDTVSGTCLNTLEGHSHFVSSVCISSDGSRIISGSEDMTVKVWDSNSVECVNTLEGHSSYVLSVCISSDGSRVLSGSWDKTVKVWDVLEVASRNNFEGHTGSLSSVCVSGHGSRIISGSDDKTVKVWNASSGVCVSTLEGHSDRVSSVCISHDGGKVISGSDDMSVKVWDMRSGVCVNTLEGHTDRVTSVCVNCGSGIIVSGSEDMTVKVWNVSSGACLLTLEGHTHNVSSVCLSKDGRKVISGSADMTLKAWNTSTGVCLLTLEGHRHYVSSVCISNDGNIIISGSNDKTVKIWDSSSGACVNTLEGHRSFLSSVCISSDGSRIISGSLDKTVKVWDASSGVCVNTLEGHNDGVSSVCISSDRRSKIISCSDKHTTVWHAVRGALDPL